MQDHCRNVTIKELPKSSERPPLFIVGDVHGCALELDELLKKARAMVSDCQIVLVGDLFTKGPDPVGVFDVIHSYDGLAIKGNHDWALISAIIHAHKKGIESLPDHTKQTLHLIRYHKKGILSFLVGLPHAYKTVIIPKRQNWGPQYNAVIVHAGIDPLIGLEATSERLMLTARWVRTEEEGGVKKLAILHSSARAEAFKDHEFHDNTCSTLNKMPIERTRWHEFHSGPDLLVFGHDATQGLFRKVLPNGRPICVGLDTGCTYGRALTGYFPETDSALQVNSKRVYFDLAKNLILGKNYSEDSTQFEKPVIRSHAS